MAFMKWSTNLSVRVAEIDSQHQQLVNFINDLSDAMKEGKGKSDWLVNHINGSDMKYSQFFNAHGLQ